MKLRLCNFFCLIISVLSVISCKKRKNLRRAWNSSFLQIGSLGTNGEREIGSKKEEAQMHVYGQVRWACA